MGFDGETIETQRVIIFLAVAFGVSWIVGVYIYLTGGLESTASPISGTPFSRAFILLGVGYMWGPAIANMVTRLVTGEGSEKLYLSLRFRSGWLYWLTALVLPAVLTIVGAAVYFGLLGGFSLVPVEEFYEQFVNATGAGLPGGVWGFVTLQILQAVLLAPLINSLFTFGEEFGWRGYYFRSSCHWASAEPCSPWVSYGAFGTGQSSLWATITDRDILVHPGSGCWRWFGLPSLPACF